MGLPGCATPGLHGGSAQQAQLLPVALRLIPMLHPYGFRLPGRGQSVRVRAHLRGGNPTRSPDRGGGGPVMLPMHARSPASHPPSCIPAPPTPMHPRSPTHLQPHACVILPSSLLPPHCPPGGALLQRQADLRAHPVPVRPLRPLPEQGQGGDPRQGCSGGSAERCGQALVCGQDPGRPGAAGVPGPGAAGTGQGEGGREGGGQEGGCRRGRARGGGAWGL